MTPEAEARMAKYGSTLDAHNVQSVIDRIEDYPEIMEAAFAALQRRLFEECEQAQWDEGKRNTFGEEITHLHEEVSEAFREWRLHKNFDVRWTCVRCGRHVPIETDLDTIRHPESGHHYTGPESEYGKGHGCVGEFKPTGIPAEFGDVLIGMAYNAELHGFSLFGATEIKHLYNLTRSYPAEGRQLHPDASVGE